MINRIIATTTDNLINQLQHKGSKVIAVVRMLKIDAF